MKKDFLEKKEKSYKITLPENPEIIKAFQYKYKEYKERLDKQIQDNPRKGPEFFAATKYKLIMIEKLLLEGELDGPELSKEITSRPGPAPVFDFEAFNNAYMVIEDYVKTGGKNVSGGTGFGIEKKAEKTEGISEASNFEELLKAIDNIEGLQGSRQFYKKDDLKQYINLVREKKIDSSYITRTGGLRDKVEELLKAEK
jgi:hypothetical protein